MPKKLFSPFRDGKLFLKTRALPPPCPLSSKTKSSETLKFFSSSGSLKKGRGIFAKIFPFSKTKSAVLIHRAITRRFSGL